ncbi:hypothetical protein BpHYR1_018570 [Brachionus plicatilis]|uniref:Uncharacterized protein n=1 Tax=Brachionus plicatilis TaxID=10195 RepID=A0A3M7PQD1_BRAPC|nr:hypothetical protein BpHYR1_018570 [Brachionus plicatilis]
MKNCFIFLKDRDPFEKLFEEKIGLGLKSPKKNFYNIFFSIHADFRSNHLLFTKTFNMSIKFLLRHPKKEEDLSEKSMF